MVANKKVNGYVLEMSGRGWDTGAAPRQEAVLREAVQHHREVAGQGDGAQRGLQHVGRPQVGATPLPRTGSQFPSEQVAE